MQFMTGVRVMLYQMLTDWRCSSAKIHTHSRMRCIYAQWTRWLIGSWQTISFLVFASESPKFAFLLGFSPICAWILWKSKSGDTICSSNVKRVENKFLTPSTSKSAINCGASWCLFDERKVKLASRKARGVKIWWRLKDTQLNGVSLEVMPWSVKIQRRCDIGWI